MDLGLRQKTALVTGSTAGIGFAIARTLAREGATVVLNGRTKERTEAAVRALAAEVPGAVVRAAAGDVGTAAGAAAVIAAAPDVDVLVLNAGIFEPRPFEQIADEEWSKMFEVNVMGGVRLARHHLPRMKARNWGRVVFVSSESAVQIPAEMIHYGMTKAAQIAIARGMAETTAGTGVTVNSVLPGPTASEGVTEFVAQMAQKDGISPAEMEKRFFETARPTSLLRRFITPDEVASAVAWLASPLASATNGAPVRVDGGVVRAML